MQNIGAYFEIPVEDLDRALKFYSRIFACDFIKDSIHGNQMAFFPFDDNKSGIAGALAKGEIYKPSISGALIYLSTPNLENTLRKVIEAGGEVLFPKTEVGEHGWVAEFKDCEGNRVALFQRAKA
ncbi:MAG: VOC family protein [Candidatus Pacebacteria bacterium]|nr:VOC family protein [Candidatus Paceibacterota bacterium]